MLVIAPPLCCWSSPPSRLILAYSDTHLTSLHWRYWSSGLVATFTCDIYLCPCILCFLFSKVFWFDDKTYFSTYLQKNPISQSQRLKYLFPKLQFLFWQKSGVYISGGLFPHELTSQEIFSDGGSKLLTNPMCFTVDAFRPIQYGLCWIYLSYVHTKGMLWKSKLIQDGIEMPMWRSKERSTHTLTNVCHLH